MVLLSAEMMWQGIIISPTRYLFVLLLGGLLVRRARTFILDWIPFVFVLVSYDFIRGLVPRLIFEIHFTEMIRFDQRLFHILPTQTLQARFFHPNTLAWYDYFGAFIYFFYFILPVAFGFLLYLIRKDYFRQFVTGFSLLSYAGYLTYILYPAASPWVAAEAGYISGVQKVLDFSLKAIFGRGDVVNIYHSMNPNPIAAIPSMHAATSFLVLLFALRFFKLKGLLVLPYVLSLWLFVVYSGEHYVTDVLVGIIYGLFFYALSAHFLHHINWHHHFNKTRLTRWLNA